MFNIVCLDPPLHRLDKQMDNLERIELRIPVSGTDNEPIDVVVGLSGN